MYQKKIKTMTNHWGHEYVGNKLSLFYIYRDTPELYEVEEGKWGRRLSSDTVHLDCDALILVTMRVPNAALFHELLRRRSDWEENEVQAVYRIGDCYAPRHLMNAIFDGHRLAREFESPHPQYPLPFVRERQIWGRETYPKLGDARPSLEFS